MVYKKGFHPTLTLGTVPLFPSVQDPPSHRCHVYGRNYFGPLWRKPPSGLRCEQYRFLPVANSSINITALYSKRRSCLLRGGPENAQCSKANGDYFCKPSPGPWVILIAARWCQGAEAPAWAECFPWRYWIKVSEHAEKLQRGLSTAFVKRHG